MSTAGHAYGGPEADGPLPAILERAQQDRQWQLALAQLGYPGVKTAYTQQIRESPKAEIFFGVKHLNHYPTMDFVRAWMKGRRRQALRRLRWTFLGAMLTTIVAAITFAVSCQCIALP
jgi:hypothetical protein